MPLYLRPRIVGLPIIHQPRLLQTGLVAPRPKRIAGLESPTATAYSSPYQMLATNSVMTSPDGITWTSPDCRRSKLLGLSVTYGNGLFVAVSSDGTNRVMTSPDGITWTARTAAAGNTWRSVTYGNGLFVAVSQDGTNRVMTSPDGITWTTRTAAQANTWLGVTYGNGLFVAVSPMAPTES